MPINELSGLIWICSLLHEKKSREEEDRISKSLFMGMKASRKKSTIIIPHF
jgi:hypothetical protein